MGGLENKLFDADSAYVYLKAIDEIKEHMTEGISINEFADAVGLDTREANDMKRHVNLKNTSNLHFDDLVVATAVVSWYLIHRKGLSEIQIPTLRTCLKHYKEMS